MSSDRISPAGRNEHARHGVDALLASMTLAEKAGQLTQVEYGSITPDEVAEWAIGSVLSGGGGNHGDGSAQAWHDGVEIYVEGSRRSRLGVPILYGTDAVHGHNNVLGATIFPHNIGLGATRNVDLARRIGRAAAIETAATGARWTFGPCLAVPQDIRWGRTYEGFSEDPEVVTELGRAMVEGWHGDDLAREGVLACAKHYVGEGAMKWGTAGGDRHPWIEWWEGWGTGWQIDQGDVSIDEAELRATHLPPFSAAIEAGALTVMASYATWYGERIHGHRYLLTDVLKRELAFDGFVVSDWLALNQIHADYPTAVERALNAGVDMVMVPFDFRGFVTTVVDLIEAGRVSIDRVDDAVARILGVKARLGLFEGAGSAPPIDVIGCVEHRSLAREAAAASAVVLVDRGALPIDPAARVLAAGMALDDIGISCGGWTISWEGGLGATTVGRTVLDGLRDTFGDNCDYEPEADRDASRASVGVVSVHERPYVEGGGDRADLTLPPDQVEVVRRLRARVDQLIVVVVSGRPLLLESILDVADAVVACWLPGSEAGGVADVLTGRVPAVGTLPVRWPRRPEQVGPQHVSGSGPDPWPVGHRVVIGRTAAEKTG
jgi:beta-glucosidase